MTADVRRSPIGGALAVPQSGLRRAERRIALARLAVATVSLVAILIDPDLALHPRAAEHGLLAAALFVAFALIATALAWLLAVQPAWLQISSHGLDVGITVAIGLILALADGPVSPFIACFVFVLVSSAQRWSWRGTAWTAGVVLVAYVGLAVAGLHLTGVASGQLGRLAVRGLFLAILGALLTQWSAYEDRLRADAAFMAAPTSTVREELQPLVGEIVTSARDLFGSPRALLVWEEREEPWLNLAIDGGEGTRFVREAPDAFEPLVDASLERAAFWCRDAGASRPLTVVESAAGGVTRWRGRPIHPDLQQRFALGAVLSAPLRSQSYRARLFVLDDRRSSSDDLMRARVFARHEAARLDQFFLLRRLRQTAGVEERVRLARELHDGVIQGLTAASLRLEALQPQLPPGSPIQRQIGEVQELLADEQQELRGFVRAARPAGSGRQSTAGATLAERLASLAVRIEWHWGLHVDLACSSEAGELGGEIAHEVFRLAHEALVNAARHGQASTARVEVAVAKRQVLLVVADDGHGFSFHGHYPVAELAARQLGPVMLKQRIASLGGSLAIDSGPAGARLEIRVPCEAT